MASSRASEESHGGHATVEQLVKDNATLRAMLRRALGPSSNRVEQSVVSCTSHLQTQLDRKDEEYRREKDRRIVAESLLTEFRQQHELHARTKELEIKKLQDALAAAKHEISALRDRVAEDSNVILVLKKENYRLNDVARASERRASMASPGGPPPLRGLPDYTRDVRPERLKVDVPSVSRHLGHVPPVVLRRTLLASASRAPSTSNTRRSASHSDPAPRSKSPGATSVFKFSSRGAQSAAPRGAPKVGSNCVWRGLQGVVRYIGRVDGLGSGEFAGVQLLAAGYGDHDGTLDGVQYFSAPPHSSLFCPLAEVRPARDFPSHVDSGSRSVSQSNTPRSAVRKPSASEASRRADEHTDVQHNEEASAVTPEEPSEPSPCHAADELAEPSSHDTSKHDVFERTDRMDPYNSRGTPVPLLSQPDTANQQYDEAVMSTLDERTVQDTLSHSHPDSAQDAAGQSDDLRVAQRPTDAGHSSTVDAPGDDACDAEREIRARASVSAVGDHGEPQEPPVVPQADATANIYDDAAESEVSPEATEADNGMERQSGSGEA